MSKKRMTDQKKRFFRKIGCTPFFIDFVIYLNEFEQSRHTMKTKLPLKTVGALALCLSFSHTLQGATLHWDVNADIAGSGNAGGTWDSGITSNWSSAATGDVATTTFTDGDIAVFSSGSDGTGSWTVNVSGLVQAGGITFEEDGSKNIDGGTIALAANTTISAAGRGNGNNYNINSLLNGAGNLTIAATMATPRMVAAALAGMSLSEIRQTILPVMSPSHLAWSVFPTTELLAISPMTSSSKVEALSLRSIVLFPPRGISSSPAVVIKFFASMVRRL